ncbi:MAG TPA: hypothetical protein VET26_03370, partial [Candidatus Sulfotelmatobacter sp.]|nr:hypothetical protein [Candidatus Sulfotelmatobacter sp.]
MEADGSFWVSLIGSVRTVFRGQLTYSSNWAKGYPSFGRTLDFISIDAYFPLNAAPTAATADLVNAWGPWIARLDRIRRSFGRPLVLTELGVTSQVASFQQPWLWDNGKPVDLVSQETYYQASCQATTPNVSGLYWWMYTIDPPAAPMLDKGFAVAGKPAEAALGRCFGGHL